MTTIGYGDVATIGNWTRLYAIAAMFVASVVFGAILSVITLVSRGILDDSSEKRVTTAMRFMKRRHVPIILRRHVERSLRHALARDNQTSMDQELFHRLAPAVQRELSLALLSETITSFPLFTGADRSFIAELAHQTTWVQCMPGDPVVEEGHTSQEVVFIVHGSLTVTFCLYSDGEHIFVPMSKLTDDVDHHVVTYERGEDTRGSVHSEYPQRILQSGGWFGEESLFDSSNVSCSNVAANAESELAILDAGSYLGVVAMYPRLLTRHQEIEAWIRTGQLDIRDLRYGSAEVVDSGGSLIRPSLVSLIAPVLDLWPRSKAQVVPKTDMDIVVASVPGS